MKPSLLLLTLVMVPVVAAQDANEKSLVEQFQQSLFEEEANRDLKKAAVGYEAVIEAFDKHRAIAASAIYRLAEVQRKQGNEEEAAALYLRLVEEFPGEETLVKLSTENLQVLGITVAPKPGRDPMEKSAVPTMRDDEAKALTEVRSTFLESPDLLEVVNPGGETLLSKAAANSFLEVARFLLDKGVDVNQRIDYDMTALHRAAQNGHLAMTKLLVERGAKLDPRSSEERTPLHYAVSRGHTSTVNYLIDAGADAKAEVELFYHYESEGDDYYRDYRYTPGSPDSGRDRERRDVVLFETGTLMHLAALSNTGMLSVLMERGLSPETLTGGNRQTPLHLAMRSQNDLAGLALVEAKVNLDAQTADGFTPLMLAAALNVPKSFQALLDVDAAPDIQAKDGRTALHIAVEGPNPTPFVEGLLSKGADVNVVANDGTTPLLLAAANRKLSVIRTLLKNGARADVPRKSDGMTPLMVLFEAHRVLYEPERQADELLTVAQQMVDQGGADINAVTSEGKNGLQILAGKVSSDAAQFYLDNQINLNHASLEDSFAEFDKLRSSGPGFDDPVMDEIWRRLVYPNLKDREQFVWAAKLGGRYRLDDLFPIELARPDQSVKLHDFLAYGYRSDWPEDPTELQVSRGGELIRIPGPDFKLLPGDVVERLTGGEAPLKVAPRHITLKLPHREYEVELQRTGSNDLVYPPNAETIIGLTLQQLLTNTGIGSNPTLNASIQVTREGKVFDINPTEQDLLLTDGDILEFKEAEKALTVQQRSGGIFISRPGDNFITEVFHHGPDIGNRHQLAEAIVEFYCRGHQVLPNPDFRKVSIRRLMEDGSETLLEFDLQEIEGSPPVSGIFVELAPGAEQTKAEDYGFQYLKDLLSSIDEVDPSTIGREANGRTAVAKFKDLGNANVVADEIRKKLLATNPPLSRYQFTTGPEAYPARFKLQWGDIIEIPSADNSGELPWIGFDSEMWFKLKRWTALSVDTEILSTGFNKQVVLEPHQPLFRKTSAAWERDISQSRNWRSISALLKNLANDEKAVDESRLLLKRRSPQITVLVDSKEKQNSVDLRVHDKVVLTPKVE